MAYGAKTPSESLALAIERESGGAVLVADLKPAFADTLASVGYKKCACPPPSPIIDPKLAHDRTDHVAT